MVYDSTYIDSSFNRMQTGLLFGFSRPKEVADFSSPPLLARNLKTVKKKKKKIQIL